MPKLEVDTGGYPVNPEQGKLMISTNQDIYNERKRQNRKWGLQRHSWGEWMKILVEEVGELAQAMQRWQGWGKETDADDIPTEAIHVAAVAQAIAEQAVELQNTPANQWPQWALLERDAYNLHLENAELRKELAELKAKLSDN